MSRVYKAETVDFCYDVQNELGTFIEDYPHEVRVLGETPLGEIGSTLLIEKVIRNKFGGVDCMLPDGKGARFYNNGKLRGFSEP